MLTHPLLLHKLGVGAVVDDVLAKDRTGQIVIDLLGIDVLLLSVQDKLVALGADVYGGLLAEEDEGENIAVLWAHPSQRGGRTHAMGGGF